MDGRESRAFNGSVPGGFCAACSASQFSSVLTTTGLMLQRVRVVSGCFVVLVLWAGGPVDLSFNAYKYNYFS